MWNNAAAYPAYDICEHLCANIFTKDGHIDSTISERSYRERTLRNIHVETMAAFTRARRAQRGASFFPQEPEEFVKMQFDTRVGRGDAVRNDADPDVTDPGRGAELCKWRGFCGRAPRSGI